MKNFKKYTLTITFAALTCTPLLHCEDTTSQAASTSRLQSVINYVKNIRTPLTPQEKLAQCITHADVDGFKTAYDAFLQSNATSEERAAMVQELTATAQETKQLLQAKLESADNKINKTMLAKGATQTVLGTYATLATMFSLAYKGEMKFLIFSKGKTNLGKICNIDGNICISEGPSVHFLSLMALLSMELGKHYLTNPIRIPESLSYHLRTNGFQTIAAVTNIIITPLTGYLAYNSLNAGIQNCKNGWNYRAYLAQQIENIDQINAFIQAQITQQ